MMILTVSTSHRAGNAHDVFVRWAEDDRCHVGIIFQLHGSRASAEWEASGLIYGTKAGAAFHLARSAVRAGATPYEPYAVALEGLGVTPPPARVHLDAAGHPGYGEAFADLVLSRVARTGETIHHVIADELHRDTTDSHDRMRERVRRPSPCCAPEMCPECFDRGGHASSLAAR